MNLPRHLGAPDWLNAPRTRSVMAALEAAEPGSARFVGGCVRNTLMGRPVDDIDIATRLTPPEVVAALELAGIRALPTGIEHGTVTAIADHQPFEITTLRRDVETDGRRAVVAFTRDWAEDAARRDFRLNALYAEPDGRLHDPVGGGISDALAGQVIFIGDADQRLREDYLRILRFFRFNAWYGAGIDPDGLAACERQKDGLAKIAAERIWKEFEKLLRAPDPTASITAMHAKDILSRILQVEDSDYSTMQMWNNLRYVERGVGRQSPVLVRLSTLLPRFSNSVAIAADLLRLSNLQTKLLENANFLAADFQLTDDRAVWRVTCYLWGADIATLAAWLVSARERAIDNLIDFLDFAETYQRSVFPLNGYDAQKHGFSGPEIGRVLKQLEDEWRKSDFSLSREALLARLSSRPPHSH